MSAVKGPVQNGRIAEPLFSVPIHVVEHVGEAKPITDQILVTRKHQDGCQGR